MGTFPDHPLLEIFSFCLDQAWADPWRALIHVCQRWRYVVLGSPRRLNLRLLCTPRRPVRKMLHIWPPLPLMISNPGCPEVSWTRGAGNVIAALRHKDRIVQISLFDVPSELWQRIIGAMKEPLPALKKLRLWSNFSPMGALPASFLGGSAPLLQSLSLNRVPYPALPKLLSTTRDLVHFELLNLPNTWYIPTEDMVACLSSLTALTTFVLESESEREPRQVTQRSSQQERTFLHSLTSFRFKGPTKYLEDLVARIDAPRLSKVVVTFVKPIVSADIPELSQFVGQADDFQLLNQADIIISDTTGPVVELRLNTGGAFAVWYELIIPCKDGWDGPPSTLAQVCVNDTENSPLSSLPLSTLEHLTISGCRDWWPAWGNRWLEFLPAFTAVKNLYLSEDVASDLLPALKDVTGESTTGVLPALQNLFLEEYQPPPKPVQNAIQEFTAVRRLADRPVTVGKWKRWS